MLAQARVHLQRLRATIGNRLGVSEARARDVDAEQAKIRIILGAGILAYAIYWAVTGDTNTPHLQSTLVATVIAASCPLLAGLWMTYRFRTDPSRPEWIRYFAISADLIPLTIGIWGAGEFGVPLVGVYLWVTVGNGLRFGWRHLRFAYCLSLACFGALVLFAPFWQDHQGIGIGFGLVLATIPLYVLVLLSRLTAQKDAALELSNAKSRFVANVSHELRTPLTGVFAVYDLLRRRRLAPDERELVGSLGNAITTLKASVDAVLQMSKLEAGAERAEQRLFNLRYFLSQLSMLVRPQATSKQLAWSLVVETEVPATVVGDPAHLQHILGNLLNNAFKFTPSGGVTLRVSRGTAGVRFEVSDTGIGIPLDQQESLFERFVQADSSETRKFGGTGLGTSIAHDLVKLMGGSIGVYSAPGHGATFWVDLPFAEPALGTPIPEPVLRNEVLVIGKPGPERDDVVTMLAAGGFKPVPQEPRYEDPPTFAPQHYLAALLLMPAQEAAAYTDAVLQDRAGTLCPWLVVTRNCTGHQAAALLKSGASGLLPPNLRLDDWRRHMCALTNRIELPTSNDDAPLQVATRKLSILLADDNHSNQMLLARILRDAGHTVSMVERGDEAYDMMAAGRIQLALLDLNMPEMSGPDATKLFRAGETGAGARLPIIILSADATAAARESSLAAGANDYITKPVAAEALLAAIERVVAGREAHRSVDLRVVAGEPPAAAPAAASAPSLPPAFLAAPPLPSKERTEAPAPILVDSERIEALRRIANNDRNFLKQYVDAAFDDLESALVELRNAVGKGDTRRARDALHKIDGTGASIGAAALLAGARSMRNYLSNALDSDAAAAIAELSTTCTLTKSAVTALLHESRTTNRPR